MKAENRAVNFGLHLGMDLVKIGLQIAAVAAGFMAVNELRKMHQKVEEHKHHHLLPHLKK